MKNNFIVILIFLVACADPYAGFNEIDEGIYFKLNELGKETASLNKADYILIDYDFCEDSNCDSAEYNRQLFINMADNHINREFWRGFHLGDQFTLIYDNKSSGFNKLFSIPDSVQINYPVIATCKPRAFHSFNSYTGDTTSLEALMDFREKAIINSWISEEAGYRHDSSGVYVQVIEVGDGDSIAVDREVALSYKAYFYNGMLFDDTDNWEDTFKYVVGIPNQVIAGISLGIDGMREGAKAKIIIPSRFAFGKAGSSTGLVPPFEPLKYDIKIIDVKVN